jgi:phosphoglycerate dehydrogenase-like enzyme
MRILFCGDTFPEARKYLAKRLNPSSDQLIVSREDRLSSDLDGVNIVIPLMCRIDAALMDAGSFRLVQQWGAGIEGVDLEAARQRGIRVANVPATGSNANSVAEHAILLALALLRDFPTALTHAKAGWLGAPIGQMLAGRTVCLYGLGAIARALANRLRAFNVRLVGITREPSHPKIANFGLDECYSNDERDACLAKTDVLIVCASLSAETRGLIDKRALGALKPGAYLVNAARGALIDYDALYSALASGRLAGAGLDVYWKEPIAPSDPLLALPNVIATPHIAGVTDGSYNEIADTVASNIERFRSGEEPLNCVV